MPSDKYATTKETNNSIVTQFTYLSEAVNIYELCLGFDHPETADAYTKIALAY